MRSDELILNVSGISQAASLGGASLRARETHRASEKSDAACLADASLWFCNWFHHHRFLVPRRISHDDVCLRVRVLV